MSRVVQRGLSMIGAIGLLWGAACDAMPEGEDSLSTNRDEIIGGTTAPRNQFPWVVHVSAASGCGGTLISPTWVLTAAHCVCGRQACGAHGSISVSADRTDSTGAPVRQTRSVAAIVEPGYSFNFKPRKDIMLLQLSSPFELSPTLRPAELPRAPLVSGATGIMANGERQGGGALLPSEVAVLSGTTFSTTDCATIGLSPFLDQFCVRSSTASAFEGDSGSGLIVFSGATPTPTPLLTGIASWIENDQPVEAGHPFALTDVFQFLDWIKTTTGLSGGTVADDFSDAAGFASVKYYSTLHYADVNGGGKPDVCARGAKGIVCALSDDGFFVRQPLWTTQYSDTEGWSQPQFYRTIQFPDLNNDGKADVCGRGGAGIYCALSNGSQFTGFKLWTSMFADLAWVDVKYYSTIRFPDLNFDKKADVCGRGPTGIMCALSTGNGFGAATQWTAQFSDSEGWGLPQYYSTIQFPDVNHDGMADICGRGGAGIFCAKSTGTAFGAMTLWTDEFSDAKGWTTPEMYSTLRFPDLSNDRNADVCGRGYFGITCALSNGTSAFGAPSLWTTWFSTPNSGNLVKYYSTIQFPDLNHDGNADMCGRGGTGVFCRFSNGTSFSTPLAVKTTFADDQGWSVEPYYSGIGFADVKGDASLEVCARGSAGVFCQ